MRINFMLFIVSFAFIAFLGLVVSEHLYNVKMAEAGLQQCIVTIDSDKYEAVWKKNCSE